jgi:methylmalonyl-CoA/ethylmalonyl-CoA epimerase
VTTPDERPPEGGTSGAGGAPVSGLAHIAIAVAQADPLVAILVGALGATRGAEESIDGGALRVVFVHLGPVTFELLEPRSSAHTVAKFLEMRGAGLHHVSLEVEDLGGALARCRDAGVKLIDETPRAGSRGTRIAFLHPQSLGGVLIELCQATPRDPAR